MHAHVKERNINGTEYFHVHVKTVISKRKIESQRYFVFNHSSKKYVSRSNALEMANRKAFHLCHRHEQIRRARKNRQGFATEFLMATVRLAEFLFANPKKQIEIHT